MKKLNSVIGSFMSSNDEEILIIHKRKGTRQIARITTLGELKNKPIKTKNQAYGRKILRLFNVNIITQATEFLPLRIFLPRSFGKAIKRNQRLTTLRDIQNTFASRKLYADLGLEDKRDNPYKGD